MIIPAVIFVVFFLGIYGAHWFFVVRPEEQALGIVRRRMTPTQNVKASLQRQLLKQQQALSSVGAFDKVLRNAPKVQPLKALIEQSGAKVSVGTVLAGSGLLALVAFYLVGRAHRLVSPRHSGRRSSPERSHSRSWPACAPCGC